MSKIKKTKRTGRMELTMSHRGASNRTNITWIKDTGHIPKGFAIVAGTKVAAPKIFADYFSVDTVYLERNLIQADLEHYHVEGFTLSDVIKSMKKDGWEIERQYEVN